MNRITKEGTTFPIDKFPWDDNGFKPMTSVTASYDEKGFYFHFVTNEKNPRVEAKTHNGDIYCDSCVEVFMQYSPENDKRYINIEMNAGGYVFSSVSYNRYERELISPEVIESMLKREARVTEDGWEIKLFVPKEYIEKYIPLYRHEKGSHLKGNFYKCGDKTPHPHFGCFGNIDLPEPDFHCPEFFTDFILD